MSNTVQGKNVFAEIEVDSVFYPIFCAKDATLSTVQEEIETTSVNSSAAREYTPGMQSATMDVNGLTTSDNTGGRVSILYLLQAAQRRTIFNMRWRMTDDDGNPFTITFSAFSTTLSMTKALAGAFSQSSASFRITGDYAISEIIPPPVEAPCEAQAPLYIEVVEGETSVHSDLLEADDVVILSVARSGSEHNETLATPGSMEYKTDLPNGDILFDPTNPFNPGEVIYILYKIDP